MGVSQSPVREALRELEVIGLIENRPYKGAFVKEISKKDIIDSYNVRMALEILGIQYAVRSITDSELAEIFLLIKEMETAVELNQIDIFIEKDSLFHQKILEVSGNDLLVTLWQQCRIRELTKLSTTISEMDLNYLATRHEKLYYALKDRNEEMCTEAVREHFETLIRELITHKSSSNKD